MKNNAYSIRRGEIPRSKDISPGPSDYNVNLLQQNSPGTIGRSGLRRSIGASYTPGPGQYESSNTREKFPTVSKGSIGYSKRWSNDKSLSPGPADYNS